MKNKIFLVLILSLILFSPKAYAQDLCSKTGYTVLTINGMFTEKKEAILNSNRLRSLLPSVYKNEPITVDFLYNGTHLGGIEDIVDAVGQSFDDSMTDYDLLEMLGEISQKVNNQKLLLVGYSQGNFYANNLFDRISDAPGGVPLQSIGVYSIATPDDHVSNNGKYITSDTDKVIVGIAGKIKEIMPPNVHIPIKGEDNNGHSFLNVYLKYKGNKIVSDIKSSLGKLKSNDIQETNEVCISPQADSEVNKLMDAVIPALDYIVEKEANSLRVIYDKVSPKIKTIFKIANKGLAMVGLINNGSSETAEAVSEEPVVDESNDNDQIVTESNGVQGENSIIKDDIEKEEIQADQEESSDGEDNEEDEALITNEHATSDNHHNNDNDLSSGENSTQENNSASTDDNSSSNNSNDNSENQNPEDNNPDNESPEVDNSSQTNDPSENNDKDENVQPEIDMSIDPENIIDNENFNSFFIIEDGGPIITLNGNSFVTLKVGEEYVDQGATAIDDKDKSLTVYKKGNEIDTSKPGLHMVKYYTGDSDSHQSFAIRIVNVIDNPSLSKTDKIPPKITINGSEMIRVSRDYGYIEPGVTITDNITESKDMTAVASETSDSSSYYDNDIQTIIYAVTDKAGNVSVTSRHLEFFDHIYEPKYTFGNQNGDGNDWKAWFFSGSAIFDWKDIYNKDGYLHEEFKIEAMPDKELSCITCMIRGVFSVNPLSGFNSTDVKTSSLEYNPQNNHTGYIYDIAIDWDESGYTTTVSQNGVVLNAEKVEIKNINENTWVGWTSRESYFRKFPYGVWMESSPILTSTGLSGGSGMILKPYQVYNPEEKEEGGEENNGSNQEDDTTENNASNGIIVNNFNELAFPFSSDDSILTLKGDKVITLKVGEIYVEQGQTCYDPVDGVCGGLIDNSNVDTSKPGLYMVKYYRPNGRGGFSIRIRLVNVVDDSVSVDDNDKIPPIITLNGDSNLKIVRDDGYDEKGVTVKDNIDEGLSVITSDTIDPILNHPQSVLYVSVDKSGNIGFAIRRVQFYDHIYEPKYTFGNQNGDENDWKAWFFNGSVIFDWKNGYVDGYLHQEFKIESQKDGPSCGNDCLSYGLFNVDPMQGYNIVNIESEGEFQPSIQDRHDGNIYQVVIQWNANGWTTKVYLRDSNGTLLESGRTENSKNNVDNGLWFGWSNYNNSHYFETYPTDGEWVGIDENSNTGLQGGKNMIIKAYPVYDPNGQVFSNVFDPESVEQKNEDEKDDTPDEEVKDVPLENAILGLKSFSLNDQTDDITINPIDNTLVINLKANRNVNWVSIKIENQENKSLYKIYYPKEKDGNDSSDTTDTWVGEWNGILSSGGLLKNGIYKVKVHMKDSSGNDYNEYLPSIVNVFGQQLATLSLKSAIPALTSFSLADDTEVDSVQPQNQEEAINPLNAVTEIKLPLETQATTPVEMLDIP